MSGKNDIHPYVILARETVRRCLNGEAPLGAGAEICPDESLWTPKRACFVSIKGRHGELRGCIGTISPVQPSIDREILANAISASTRDPRFDPMTADELDSAVFSVDVLSEPEQIQDLSLLDPAKWGVIVSSGFRRGVLLPDLDGVDTVEAQLDIAARKAGIRDVGSASIERFSVDRYRE
ncbi:MAG: AmmeMemoRadiSam system protein A [Synergistaceae bacterium]|nr:AmmeMemoRadiSam system protein A [Synergistaceae bacterium]